MSISYKVKIYLNSYFFHLVSENEMPFEMEKKQEGRGKEAVNFMQISIFFPFFIFQTFSLHVCECVCLFIVFWRERKWVTHIFLNMTYEYFSTDTRYLVFKRTSLNKYNVQFSSILWSSYDNDVLRWRKKSKKQIVCWALISNPFDFNIGFLLLLLTLIFWNPLGNAWKQY